MLQSHIRREELLALCDAVAPQVNWAFVHIPRTGGTAFRTAYGSGPARPPARAQHPADLRVDAEYLFAFLRNPFDRAVSLCAYLHPSRTLDEDTFRDWVLSGFPSPALRTLPITSPQTHWLDERVVRVQYEAINEELPIVLERIDEDLRRLPRINTSKRARDWRGYYDVATREAVLKRYREDFDLGLWPTSTN